MALTELTLAQWATAKRTPNRVQYINDPALTDVMYAVEGSPGVLVINLAYYADLVDGKIAGAAIDADSLAAAQIGAGGVGTSELATDAVTGVKIVDAAIGAFDLPTAVAVDHGAGAPVELLALDATVDRIVMVRAVCTEAAAGSEIDVGSAGTADSLFDDIGGGTYAIGDKFQGMCLVEAGGNLRATINTAGTAGAFNMYVTVVTPLVQTAQIAALAVTNAKIAAATIADSKMVSSLVKEPGKLANAVLRISGNCAVTDTVTIGTDVFELDDITAVSGDTAVNGSWNNMTDPVTIPMAVGDYAAIGVAGVDPLQVGDLVYLGTEYMRVSAIDGDNVTFTRGCCGSTAAAHIDTTGIFIATTPHVANIQIGSQAGGGAVTPANFTPALVGTILEDVGTAGQANDVSVASLAAGATMLLVADAVGAVVLATTETGGNLDWDDTTMRYGEAAVVRQTYTAAVVPDAEEVTANLIYLPIPFDPTFVQVFVVTTATGAVVEWSGDCIINVAAGVMPAYLELNNDGATNFSANETMYVLAVA